MRWLFTLFLLSISISILSAQSEGHRYIEHKDLVLDQSGDVNFNEGQVKVPYSITTPFITFAIRLYDVELKDTKVYFWYETDDGRVSDPIDPGYELHGPEIQEYKVTQMVFYPEDTKFIRYRIESKSKDQLRADLHVFVPSIGHNLTTQELPMDGNQRVCDLSPYMTRTGWGCPSGQDYSNGSPSFTQVSHLVVHHSAGANASNNWPAVVLSIWNFHRFTNGWDDIGYNLLIDPNGQIYEGRGGNDGFTLDVLPAATCGSNSGTMAVCLLGNFEGTEPAELAVSSLEDLLAWKASQNGIIPEGSSSLNSYGVIDHIFGHRQGCTTACPGQNLYDQLGNVRTNVANAVNGLCTVNPPYLTYIDHSIDDNDDGESNGDNDGIVESGETIEVYVTLENLGDLDAENVVASVTTEVTCVSFIDSDISFGTIEGGEQKTEGDFDIVFAPDCEDQVIPFVLTMSTDDTTWLDTIWIEVFNNCAPVASFTSSPTTGPAPLEVSFMATSPNATAWEWIISGPESSTSILENTAFTFTLPGSYTIQLTVYNECGSDIIIETNLVVVDVVSNAVEETFDVTAYPNPVHDVLFVQLNDALINADLVIYSASGQTVQSDKVSGSELEIPVKDLPVGMYVLRIYDSRSTKSWSGEFIRY